MQIRVEDPDARSALESAFAEAGCPALPDGDTIQVVHPDPLALRFFVRAWALQHPHINVEFA